MQCVCSVTRRGKYLLITTDEGTLLIHLGMSGNLRFLREPITPSRHDHIDFIFTSGAQLRFNDPRRFGSVHFTNSPTNHWLIKNLGPEPLGNQFSANYLSRVSHQRRVAIKQFLMNNRIVVGIGNIYASEALFRAGVHPKRSAGRIAERSHSSWRNDASELRRWKRYSWLFPADAISLWPSKRILYRV